MNEKGHGQLDILKKTVMACKGMVIRAVFRGRQTRHLRRTFD